MDTLFFFSLFLIFLNWETRRTKDKVKQAKELLEYVERRYPIASSEATMLMKNGGTVAGGGVSTHTADVQLLLLLLLLLLLRFV